MITMNLYRWYVVKGTVGYDKLLIEFGANQIFSNYKNVNSSYFNFRDNDMEGAWNIS